MTCFVLSFLYFGEVTIYVLTAWEVLNQVQHDVRAYHFKKLTMFRTIQTKQPYGYIYILTNRGKTVLYIGVTSNLLQRIAEHKNRKYPKSFTAKYNCDRLIYYEGYNLIQDAIAREKQLKNWRRSWKEDLINKHNPTWRDLYEDLLKGIMLE